MSHQTKDGGSSLVVGGVLGIIAAAVLATPFYGFAPVLAVSGGLVVAAIALKAISRPR